jgi:hypothetical protein
LGNRSGTALAVKMNKVKHNIPTPTIPNRYLRGYPPIKHKSRTMENIMPAVEKLAGNMSTTTKKTGIQSGRILSLNVMVLSFIFVKYLAT